MDETNAGQTVQPLPTLLNAFIFDEKNQNVGIILTTRHDFKTGSKGFYGHGKLDINGRKYQVSVQLVEIGSKPVNGTK